MSSLGKLAAGLAHELNNPASAVARNAPGREARLSEVEEASRALGAAGSEAQKAAIERSRELCSPRPARRSAVAPRAGGP